MNEATTTNKIQSSLRALADNLTGNDSAGRKARELVEQGWRATYAALFGGSFVDVLAQHHAEAILWHWQSRLAIIKGEKPEYHADFEKWARGHMKSTCARRIAVVDAFISYSYGVGGYCLYFSGTDNKTDLHAVSINQLLQSKAMHEYAPALTRVRKSEKGGRSLGWKATFFYTDAGYIFHFGSLQSGLAGGNVEDLRPTLLIPDDIDDRKDSPAIAERNTKAFTTEILPMGKTGTLTLFAQNLISRYSVMYRIHKGQLKVLTNRRPSEPVPAVENLEIEYRTVGGIITPFIVGGTATWEKGMPLSACEEELQRIGEDAFRSECQHEVELSKAGVILHTYDDDVHVISESQFASRYGSADAWLEWYKTPFNDWARTKTAFHANVAGFATVSSQNTRLPGLAFYIPLSFAANAVPEDVATRLLSLLTPFAYGTTTWKELIQEGFERENADRHFTTWQERLEYARAFIKNTVKQYSRAVLSAHNVRSGVMSHSEDTVRSVYNDGFGFSFMPSNPTTTQSIEHIVKAFSVDYGKTHLFDDSKMGYTRSYIIAPDDKTKPYVLINNLPVYPPSSYKDVMQPDDLMDSDLMRYQLRNWRWAENKLTELGERVDVPLKLNDDFGQSLQMIFKENLLKQIKLTVDETVSARLEELLPAAKMEQIQATGSDAYIAHQNTNKMRLEYEVREEIKKRTEPSRPSWADIG